MIYIALSVICSVTVSIILKLAPRWQIDLRQAIAGGYLVAGAMCLLILRPAPDLLLSRPGGGGWWLMLALGLLLPSIFLVLAHSVQAVGIVRTDAAQRLSLLLPLIAAFTVFGESLSPAKVLGIGLGLLAIGGIVARPVHVQPQHQRDWLWPAAVFLGMGVIDILFKQMSALTATPFADVLFATFATALLLSAAYVAALYWRGQAQWRWQHALGAVLIGGFNFGNIVFYILAHRSLPGDPALVFSSMNIGVIVLAALIGLGFFHERLGRVNIGGLLLAVAAVGILARA